MSITVCHFNTIICHVHCYNVNRPNQKSKNPKARPNQKSKNPTGRIFSNRLNQKSKNLTRSDLRSVVRQEGERVAPTQRTDSYSNWPIHYLRVHDEFRRVIVAGIYMAIGFGRWTSGTMMLIGIITQ
uniref:Uncharacterized protein n=1 Tax=Helianthus annuus TaxID=4232 RepID=A0A251SR70_HELAN